MIALTSKAQIDLDGVPSVGSPDAQVTVVEYACARCPFCAKITPQLYEAVDAGSLRGKAKLYFKVFPWRSPSAPRLDERANLTQRLQPRSRAP